MSTRIKRHRCNIHLRLCPRVIHIGCEAASFARDGPRCVAASVGCVRTAVGKRGVPEVPQVSILDRITLGRPGSLHDRSGDDLVVGAPRYLCRQVDRVLVETLLDRGADADVAEAEAAIDRLAGMRADGFE